MSTCAPGSCWWIAAATLSTLSALDTLTRISLTRDGFVDIDCSVARSKYMSEMLPVSVGLTRPTTVNVVPLIASVCPALMPLLLA